MKPVALILTYHAVERDGTPPLCVEPELLARQLDCVVASGAEVLTVSELATRQRASTLDGRAVALTFDDGFAGIATHAAPLLRERGLVGTLFCVAERLGQESDWDPPTRSTPRRALLDADGLRALAASGWEIGAHGLAHAPLGGVPEARVAHELSESKRLLEAATGEAVRSFAFPYGSVPADAGRLLAAAGYEAACTTELRPLSAGDDPLLLPRVDIHYLRRLELLRAALEGNGGTYLRARRLAAGVRRALPSRSHA